MKPRLRSAHFKFHLNSEEYRLHSILFEDENKSFNRLIGDDFLAFDYDQDGTIDYIALGDVDFNKVQKIYNIGIQQATRENKLLKAYVGYGKYIYENRNHFYEINS